ncbi:MAG TPA: S8 family serine peptidase, partial [Thermoanaerobaculia bacterium]|nr:S8 family serine peptidase [Thermoanaerobaculia bacterium]
PRVPGGEPAGPETGGPESPIPPGPVALAGSFPVHDGVARGHVVVRFRDEVPGWQREAVAVDAGGRAYRPARFADFARVEVGAGRPLGEVLRALRGNPAVLWAGTDPLYSGLGRGALPAPSHQPIDDPFFSLQWNLERIRWHAALDLNPTGGRGVVVAVIDSGVAFGSGAAFPARRGVDLEGVSFLPGFDFVDPGSPPFDEGVALGERPVPPTSPRFGHGTFAAAQIAAAVGNGLAIAGIAPRVTILPVRVLGADNRTSASTVAEAIRFAVGAGADVINLSLGGPEPFEPMRQAIDDAVRAGVVVVAAAGNEGGDDPPADVIFPARYEGAIAVGATAFDGGRASYSNTGPGLDLMAPAGESTQSIRGPTRDAVPATSFLHDPVTGETVYGGFFATGTSFAAPQVAAAAALLMALGVDDPAAVRFLLEQTAQDLAAPGRDGQTGEGLLDLLRAHQGLGFAS